VGNVLKRHGIAPAPKRSQSTSWKEFIQSHMVVLAGIDFFTVEVLSWRGLVTYYVLFFIHLESRRVSLAGITRHPDQAWMQQMARSATGEEWGFLEHRRYALHDRDTKFCSVFRETLAAGGIKPIPLPAGSPNLVQQKQSRSAQGIVGTGAALVCFVVFADNLLRRIEGLGENMLWVSSGRWELIVVSGTLSVLMQLLFWSEVVDPGTRRTHRR
jgi:hypothetical protein